MRFPCVVRRLADGRWSARYTGSALRAVEVTARSRDEALAKLRNELRFLAELCPCSGVAEDYVQLEVTAETA